MIFQLQSSVLAHVRSTRNSQEKKEIQPWVEKWSIWTWDLQISNEVPLITKSLKKACCVLGSCVSQDFAVGFCEKCILKILEPQMSHG